MKSNDNDRFQQQTTSAAADVFRRLFDRAASRIAAVDDANERANAAVKTLSLLYSQRVAFGAGTSRFSQRSDAAQADKTQAFIADWRRRFDAFVADVRALIADVENAAERAYLRRILLEAALPFSAFEPESVERLADSLLAEIDDEEERQNALYRYLQTLAVRVVNLENFEETRAKTLRLAEELDDLRQFEEIVGALATAVLFNAPNDRKRIANEIQTNADVSLEPVDAATFCVDVRAELDEIESDAGFLRFFGALPEAFGAWESFRSAELRRAFEVETRRRLTQLIATLDSGKNADGEPLDEADLDELRAVAETVAFADSPFVLEGGDFWRNFALRFRRFDALTAIFQAFDDADSVSSFFESFPDIFKQRLANARELHIRRAFWPRSNAFYADEKEKTLDAARRLASDRTLDESPRREIDVLFELAKTEFIYGESKNGKSAVRKILTKITRISTAVERAAIYRRLVEIHLDVKLEKAAKKLAALLVQTLDEIEPEDVRDREKADAFSTLLRADVDDETLSEFVESIETPSARFAVDSERDFERIFAAARRAANDAETIPSSENAAALSQALDVWRAELDRRLDAAFERAAELPEPDAEIFALVELGDDLHWQTYRLTLDVAAADSEIRENRRGEKELEQ